jgi:hypothetical protein
MRSCSTGTIVQHGGATGGYRSFVGFDADRHVGAVALAMQAETFN